MSLVSEWKIEKLTGACGCGRPFAEGEEFTAALFAAGEAFVRRDFCRTCWNEPAEAYSFWRARAPRKDEKRRENPMAVWAFFESLSADPAPERRKLAFLLSLTLQRKRILKMTGTKRDGAREYLVLEKRPEGNIFEIQVPDIREDEMAALRDELVRLLDQSV
jgi:hypothetical protein